MEIKGPTIMGFFKRKQAYLKQTGSKSLTPKQRRRAQQKINAYGLKGKVTVVV